MNSIFDRLLRWLRCKKVIRHIPKDSVVCDIGCGGKCLFLKNISNLIKKGIGFDEEAEDYADLKLEIKKYQISELIPLKDESCDIVTMMAVLEHLSKPQEILNESWRILRNGGKLILTTPTPFARPLLEFLAFKLKIIDKEEIRDHKNYFGEGNIGRMLLAAGFKKENINNYFFEFRLNSLIIAEK